VHAIDEKRLLYFYETVRAGTMRAASEKLDLAPSSISRQLALLEQDIGLPLIERGRRTIQLTQAGELVLEYYRQRRAQDEVFRSRIEDLHGLREGDISVAMGEGFITHHLSGALSAFSQEFPGIRVNVAIAHSNEIVRRVIDDEAHFGMIIQAPHEPRLSISWSRALELKAIVARDHPLSSQDRVTLAQLKDYPLALVESGFRIRQVISEAEAHEQVFLTPVLNTNSLFLLRRFVSSGGGITVLPETVFRGELEAEAVHALQIDNEALLQPMAHIITRSGRQLPLAALKLLQRFRAVEPL